MIIHILLLLQSMQIVQCSLGISLESTSAANQLKVKPFQVFWNAPSERCGQKHKQPIDLDSFDIASNANQSFYGSKIVLFYAHELGFYPYVNSQGQLKNGGLPQRANISAHFAQMSLDIDSAMPNADHEGLAVIDWESWNPIWEANWGDKRIYQEMSISLVKKQYPAISDEKAKVLAERDFTKAAKSFMLKTLKYAKLLRPNSKWGFYYYPICSQQSSLTGTCSRTYEKINDKLQWLYEESTAFYPSIYLKSAYLQWPAEQRHAYIQARLRESQRLATKQQAIYVYTTFAYDTYADDMQFYDKSDLCSSLKQSADAGIAGAIIWGSWSSVSTAAKCKSVGEYVSDLLGPYALLVHDMANKCSLDVCHGHGQCAKAYCSQCTTISALSQYHCVCEGQYLPPDCKHTKNDYLQWGYQMAQIDEL